MEDIWPTGLVENAGIRCLHLKLLIALKLIQATTTHNLRGGDRVMGVTEV